MGKTVAFRCGSSGVISKEAPDLLKDGQYRFLQNVMSNQEGSLASRTGAKRLGTLSASEPTCYFIRKLVVTKGEHPTDSSAWTNPRYLGILTSGAARNIWRSTKYTSGTSAVVATGVDTNASRHWEMADYAAGESGSAWAYFACPNKMLKDSGNSPYGTLPAWGIQAAVGVALATPKVANASISAIDNSLDTWAGVVITLAADAAISDFDDVTISGVSGLTLTTSDGRTNINDTWSIRIGVPDSSGKITNASTQFRIFDANGQAVQATGVGSGGSVANLPVAGNLDGGSESSLNSTQPYDWVFVYEETDTGDKGNPSQTMTSAGTATYTSGAYTYKVNPLAIHNGIAKVTVWGTGDARIGFIKVFRRGGVLADTWRQIARVPNPGAETAVEIEDNNADADIVYADLVETDNDPPVTSSVPAPIRSTSSGPISVGFQTVTLAAGVLGPVTPGTLVHIVDAANSEDVRIETVPGSTQFRAYFQFAHASGVAIEINAISGQPCNLAVTIDESVLVAGDPNNPHILYKSKRGFPQAFPVGTDAAGAVTSIGVGSPADGIVNIVECRGQVLCLNVSTLRVVAVLQGSLTQPYRAADKGLKGQSAWCKTTDGSVWFLSDDGVYSWDGNSLTKRSEAIDNLFHDQQINGMSPLDRSAASMAAARMECRRGIVRLLYTDIAGNVREIACEPLYGDRWTPMRQDVYETSSPQYPTTMLYCEPDTQALIIAANNPLVGAEFGIGDVTVVTGGLNLTSDWWTGAPTAGSPIPWEIDLPWFDMGSPVTMKKFEEVWLDIDPQIYAHGTYTWDATIRIDLMLDYSETIVETFKIVIPTGSTNLTGRQLLSLLPNLQNTSGSIYESYGREARAISFKISGQAYPVQMSLFRVIFQYEDVGALTGGASADWMDLGSKHDKRLYQMAVVFETAGTDRNIVLETRGGRDGKTAGPKQVFNLSSPTDLGSGRCLKIMPLADATIAKLMRVRPYSSAVIDGGSGNTQSAADLFRILEVTFPDAEEYPPDIVSRAGSVSNGKVTEAWTTGGYDYDKFANQISFEVNTNGVAVTAQPQADGANIGPAIVITSTEKDRKRNITVPAGLKGKAWSLFVDPAQAALTTDVGMWQLFNLSWKFQPADKGEVGHTFDWDDCGHPWDKYGKTLTIEWDDTGGADVPMQVDILGGITGQVITADIFGSSIKLGGGRGKKVFPFAADTIFKAIRVYPKGNTIPTGFKQWRYFVDAINYPADFLLSTEWKDAQSPDDKNPSWLWVDMDTENVAALFDLHNEKASALTSSHIGTRTNRKVNYAIPVDTFAKMWRMLLTPGINGKTQLFDWGFARWHPWDLGAPDDPPEIVLWTPWTDFGYPHPKEVRDLILKFNSGGFQCGIGLQSEDGTITPFTATTTYASRNSVLTSPAGVQGSLFRLLFTPSPKGLAQLWSWNLDFVKLPPKLTRWSSLQQGFGYRGWKFFKQAWFDYLCGGTVNAILTSDTGSITITLPAHPTRRDPERVLLSDIWPNGLNKSKLLSVDIVASSPASPFQMFGDLSGIEWMPCGADRHMAYQQANLSSFMEVPL